MRKSPLSKLRGGTQFFALDGSLKSGIVAARVDGGETPPVRKTRAASGLREAAFAG
jgi:hypothetical protein